MPTLISISLTPGTEGVAVGEPCVPPADREELEEAPPPPPHDEATKTSARASTTGEMRRPAPRARRPAGPCLARNSRAGGQGCLLDGDRLRCQRLQYAASLDFGGNERLNREMIVLA